MRKLLEASEELDIVACQLNLLIASFPRSFSNTRSCLLSLVPRSIGTMTGYTNTNAAGSQPPTTGNMPAQSDTAAQVCDLRRRTAVQLLYPFPAPCLRQSSMTGNYCREATSVRLKVGPTGSQTTCKARPSTSRESLQALVPQ